MQRRKLRPNTHHTHIKTADIAIRYRHVVEATGNNDGDEVERFLRGDAGLPWCAAFIWCCNDESDDDPIPGGYWKNRSVAVLEENFKRAGQWMGKHVEPEPNDLIFWANRAGSDKGTGRHVDIIMSVDGPILTIIGGNVSDRVTTRIVDMRKISHRVTGFGRLRKYV